jgi:hypothetical protein
MKLAFLIGIEVTAFLLIIAESYFFFNVVVPLGPFPHNLLEYTGYSLLKVVMTAGLGVVWFLVTLGLTRLYMSSRLSLSPRPSS